MSAITDPLSYLTNPTQDEAYAKTVRSGLRSLTLHEGDSIRFWVTDDKIQAIANPQIVLFFDPNILPPHKHYKADGRLNCALDICTLMTRDPQPDFTLTAQTIQNIENLLPTGAVAQIATT